MKAHYHEGRPACDYRGAHVLTPDGRLGEIVSVVYRESPPAYLARLRHFNGEPFPGNGYVLSVLEILSREET